MKGLCGKHILIAGGSSGIGAETAYVLAEHGAAVTLLARREDRLQQICSAIGAEQAAFYTADLADSAGIRPLFSRITAERGRLDGLVYAAGITDDVPLKFLDSARLQNTFQINFFSFIECVRQASAKQNYNPGLRIVGISSAAAAVGEKAHTAYAASKAAMDAAVRCLAKELWSRGIALNTVQPGMIRTDMYQAFLTARSMTESEGDAAVRQSQYAGLGETRDVANAVAFLLSPEARFITGASLPVDGGATTS